MACGAVVQLISSLIRRLRRLLVSSMVAYLFIADIGAGSSPISGWPKRSHQSTQNLRAGRSSTGLTYFRSNDHAAPPRLLPVLKEQVSAKAIQLSFVAFGGKVWADILDEECDQVLFGLESLAEDDAPIVIAIERAILKVTQSVPYPGVGLGVPDLYVVVPVSLGEYASLINSIASLKAEIDMLQADLAAVCHRCEVLEY